MDGLKSMKNSTLVLVASLALVPLSASARPPAKPATDTAVRSRAAAFLTVWNQHDSKAMATFWDSDGDLINLYGRVAKGPEEIANNLAGEHATDMRLATMATSALAVRMIDPTIALADWDVDVTGVVNPDASAAPAVKEHWTILMHRRDGLWRFIAVRVSSFVTAAPVVR